MTNRPLFKPDTESILVRGLNSMTLACDSLTKRNEKLTEEIDTLTSEVIRLKDKLFTNSLEKE